MNDVNELLGKTLTEVIVDQMNGDDEIIFRTKDVSYKMYHSQDCCESVGIDDINGDIEDLIGNPLLIAEEVSSENEPPPDNFCDGSFTWTFYKFATVKGYVDIRWFGSSNGYYSEHIDFEEINY
jgi:hypothetical protein